MNKHTPGPWIFRQAKGKVLAYIAMGGKLLTFKSKISDADAALIAAAPDLLEALEELKCELILSDVDMDYIESHFRKALNKAHAAIARARGEA